MNAPTSDVKTGDAGTAEIGYAEFGEWYDGHRARVLEPALQAAEASLQHVLTELLSDRDLARIRNITGRVKSKRRTWRKIHLSRYESRVATLDDIAGAIDDMVGLRVTCINLRDIEMIQAALDALPRVAGPGLWLDPASERDYVSEPKESGYRGWHVNLGLEVNGSAVVCELQIRTLLQDSWGELTHEETYSKDGELPPLVDVLSTRMSDLLSILDDIAEDLRTELDRIDQEVVAKREDPQVVADDALAGQAADAATLLHERWMSITRPTNLAGLAWALQREFGAEINDGWFGHGSFKRFLHHAVPDGEISTGRQAYLLPITRGDDGAGDDGDKTSDAADPTQADNGRANEAAEHEAAQHHSQEADPRTAPGAARQLRRIDPQFPLPAVADWPIVFEHLAESWRRIKPTDASVSTVNRLTRSARDLARGAGASLSRRTLDYVVTTLLAIDGSELEMMPPPSGPVLAERFAALTIERMIELRILDSDESRAAVRVQRWIGVAPEH